MNSWHSAAFPLLSSPPSPRQRIHPPVSEDTPNPEQAAAQHPNSTQHPGPGGWHRTEWQLDEATPTLPIDSNTQEPPNSQLSPPLNPNYPTSIPREMAQHPKNSHPTPHKDGVTAGQGSHLARALGSPPEPQPSPPPPPRETPQQPVQGGASRAGGGRGGAAGGAVPEQGGCRGHAAV